MKVCTKCKTEQPATTEFFYERGRALNSHCRKCRRAAAMLVQQKACADDPDFNRKRAERRLWGAGTYDALVARQGERCGICGRRRGLKRLHVDHDHETGVVRGLLCSGCNRALGLFGDSLDRLTDALTYLISPPCALLGFTYKPFELTLETTSEGETDAA